MFKVSEFTKNERNTIDNWINQNWPGCVLNADGDIIAPSGMQYGYLAILSGLNYQCIICDCTHDGPDTIEYQFDLDH